MDFEDDVIAEAAHAFGAEIIVTRDAAGFRHASVRAMAPEELLAGLGGVRGVASKAIGAKHLAPACD